MLHEELNQLSKNLPGSIPVIMYDHDDYYKVEISLAGVHREELMVSIQGGILSIEILPHHELGPVDQKIMIPGYIECEFVTASFLLGILNVFLPKAKMPPDNHLYPVVVY